MVEVVFSLFAGREACAELDSVSPALGTFYIFAGYCKSLGHGELWYLCPFLFEVMLGFESAICRARVLNLIEFFVKKCYV